MESFLSKVAGFSHKKSITDVLQRSLWNSWVKDTALALGILFVSVKYVKRLDIKWTYLSLSKILTV